MKSFRRLSLGYFVALAAAALLSATVEAAPNKAVVRAVRGDAQISNNKGQSWAKAKVGQALAANSLIKTPKGGSADLFLGENGPVVRVTEDTIMGIDKLDLEATGLEKVIETQLDLKNGRILGSVKKLAAASKYEVKTPVGVAGIRGTEYSISSSGVLNVVSGTVVIVYVVDGVVQPPVIANTGQQVQPPVRTGETARLSQVNAVTVGEVTVVTALVTTDPSGRLVTRTDDGRPIQTNPDGSNPGGATSAGTPSTTTTTTTTGDGTTGTQPTTTGTTTLPPRNEDLTEIQAGEGNANTGGNEGPNI